jgi:hypothetical protein
MRKKCDKCGRFIGKAVCNCGSSNKSFNKSLLETYVQYLHKNFRVVDFDKQPLLLEQFEEYAKTKNKEISDIIIGFAALGYKAYLKGIGSWSIDLLRR